MSVAKRTWKTRDGRNVYWEYRFCMDKVNYREGGFATKREAEAAEARKRAAILRGERRVVPTERVSFEQYMETFLEDRTLKRAASTVQAERRRAVLLVRAFGTKRVSDITAGQVEEFVSQRKRAGLAARSINLDVTLLRSFFRYAQKNGFININPAREVAFLHETRDEKWIPTEGELGRFVAEVAKTPSALVMVPWVWFRAYTGTRPTESVNVEWTDIDFEHNRITIRPKDGSPLKNGSFRVVAMHPQLKPLLLAWREEWHATMSRWMNRHGVQQPPHQWEFFHPRQHAHRVTNFNNCFDLARRKAGLPRLNSYTFRHYFISKCIMCGVSFSAIKAWVGHASTMMIERVYGHLQQDYLADEMAKLQMTTPGGSSARTTQ